MVRISQSVLDDPEVATAWAELVDQRMHRAYLDGRGIHNTLLPKHHQVFTELKLVEPYPSKAWTPFGLRVLAYGSYFEALACGDDIVIEEEES
jgi:hypothetical protein